MPGRPPVEPFLHGERDWEPPQTRVGWRTEVEEITEKRLLEYPARDLLELYPLRPHELLSDRSDRIFHTLKKLMPAEDLNIWVVDDEGTVEVRSWQNIVEDDKDRIEGKILLLPPRLGGLDRGLFTASAGYDADKDYDVSDKSLFEIEPARVRCWSDGEEAHPAAPPGMKQVARIAFTELMDEDEKTSRIWHWFVRRSNSDPDAQGGQNYPLQPHLNDTKEAATHLAAALSLESELCEAVILAAAYHDVGKDRERWQNSIGNRDYPDVKWAKSRRYTASGERLSYRHEFGSILDVQDEPTFQRLADDTKDLVLHLMGAHHGRARPHFNARECLDDKHPTQVNRDFAVEVPRRFARLQRRFGRWGLAYLESLVRTADYQASAKAERGDQ
jgi:CRISPR-associated endonuclease/helicase Cas3